MQNILFEVVSTLFVRNNIYKLLVNVIMMVRK